MNNKMYRGNTRNVDSLFETYKRLREIGNSMNGDRRGGRFTTGFYDSGCFIYQRAAFLVVDAIEAHGLGIIQSKTSKQIADMGNELLNEEREYNSLFGG